MENTADGQVGTSGKSRSLSALHSDWALQENHAQFFLSFLLLLFSVDKGFSGYETGKIRPKILSLSRLGRPSGARQRPFL